MLSGFFGNDRPGIVKDDCAVMQYTGLKDKNGKEIYEGDIVKVTDKYDDEYSLAVRWINHLAGFFYVDGQCKEGEWVSQINMYDNGEEVIGNIYENPELLKRAESED